MKPIHRFGLVNHTMRRISQPMSLLYSPRDVLAERAEALRVGDRDLARPGHDDRLQVLAAVDGAEALTAEGVVAVVHHARDPRLLLAGRTDRADADLGADRRSACGSSSNTSGISLPQSVAGGLDGDLVVADDEHHRLAGAPGDQQRVVAGVAELARDAAARVRVGPRAGERRLADDLDATREGRAHAREQARDDREAGLGCERVGARREVLPHEVRTEPVATEEVLEDGLVDGLHA